MYISFDIAPIILILLGASLLFTLIYILWEYRKYRSLKNAIADSAKINSTFNDNPADESIGVSVVVYANNDTVRLAHNLPLLLEQNYPLFEVIVVNDGATESTKDLLAELELKHQNLYYTFTPDDACNLSRKKLSLMLGIKAAKYEIIITTNSNCTPQSRDWISSMAKHFPQGADVVIGYSRLAHGCDKKTGNVLRSFLSLRNGITYLTQAIRHKPYRGTSDNLAYRKSLFFANKGFSHSMHLHYGDDDLFVNEIATKENTHVEISLESIITTQYDRPEKMFQLDRIRHEFTSRLIKTTAFLKTHIQSTIYYLNLLTIVSSIILGYTNIVVLSTSAIIFITTITLQILLYRKIASILQSRRLALLIPFLTIIQPIANCYYRLKSRRHTACNYTWQPLKN